MSIAKELEAKYEERGYLDSGKWICANNFGDEYIKKYIRTHGEKRSCDFARDKEGRKLKGRKCIPFEELMSLLMKYINFQFPEA